MMHRPNIILFITHDTGRFLSPYGQRTVHSPNCERLAAEGVLFEQTFCAAPLCSPARAACVTGRYPHENGVMGLTGPHLGGFDFYEGEQHAAKLFADAGYESVLCGFEHESPAWQDLGFHRSLSGPGGWYNGGGDLRDHAAEMDAWLGQRNADQPFYLQIGCHETHQGWTQYDTPPDDSRGVVVPPHLHDIPDVRREMAEFQGAIRRLDDCLGQMLDVIDQHRIADDTIFVFTTDHGMDFPRAKGTLYDQGVGVFHFMRYPRGDWGRGRRIDAMLSQVDFLPTLLEAAGLDVPANVTGRSFLPLLEDKDYEAREAVYAEKTYHDTYDPSRAVRTARYKYIRHFEVQIFQDLRLATMNRRHYFKQKWFPRPVEELYDVETDRAELYDLAEDNQHQDTLEDMRARLLTWMQQTNDPLLQGPVPSPHYQAKLKAFRQGRPTGVIF